jgi:hypothetical protein
VLVSASKHQGTHMGNDLRNRPKVGNFDDWKELFLHEAEAWKALKRVTHSEAERFVVLELLFHHVSGNYWLGASPKDWKAFKGQLNAVRRRALDFSSAIKQFGESRIFSLPLLTAAAFLAREGRAFPWRQKKESPVEVYWSSAAEALTKLADYIKYVLTEGDEIWDFRDFGNLNLILLSTYMKRSTGKWQDEAIAKLVRIASKVAGTHWTSEKNPGAAIAEVRRRFRSSEPRLKRLLLAVDQNPADRALKKRVRFLDLSSVVRDFVAAMEAGDTKEFNGSLLGFINLYMVLELQALERLRL